MNGSTKCNKHLIRAYTLKVSFQKIVFKLKCSATKFVNLKLASYYNCID